MAWEFGNWLEKKKGEGDWSGKRGRWDREDRDMVKEREGKGVRGERKSVREQVYKSTSYCSTFFTPSMSVFVDTILESSPQE